MYKCYPRREYIEALVEALRNAQKGDTISIATMSFKPKIPEIKKLIHALESALAHGCKITLLIDAYAFPMAKYSPNGEGNHCHPKIFSGFCKCNALRGYIARGGRLVVTNLPKSYIHNRLAHRNHMKFAVINSEVFIGGCNLTAMNKVDIMVQLRNKKLSSYLIDMTEDIIAVPYHNVANALLGKDREIKLNENTLILQDAGVPGSSLIYSTALELARHATTKMLLTSQYPPHGKIMRYFKDGVRKNVEVIVYYAYPWAHSTPNSFLMWLAEIYGRTKLPSELYSNRVRRYIHAKVLICDDGALIGSHNYSHIGVRLGTAELTLMTNDKKLIENIRHSIIDQLEN